MKEMAVMVTVAAAVMVTLVVMVAVEVAAAITVAAVLLDREILVHRPITRRCVSSMTRPKPCARIVDVTVANVPIREAAKIYPA